MSRAYFAAIQIVYILDQVRALENEMVLRLKRLGLDVTPKILIVSFSYLLLPCAILTSFMCIRSTWIHLY
jgi:hypothetical protein